MAMDGVNRELTRTAEDLRLTWARIRIKSAAGEIAESSTVQIPESGDPEITAEPHQKTLPYYCFSGSIGCAEIDPAEPLNMQNWRVGGWSKSSLARALSSSNRACGNCANLPLVLSLTTSRAYPHLLHVSPCRSPCLISSDEMGSPSCETLDRADASSLCSARPQNKRRASRFSTYSDGFTEYVQYGVLPAAKGRYLSRIRLPTRLRRSWMSSPAPPCERELKHTIVGVLGAKESRP